LTGAPTTGEHPADDDQNRRHRVPGHKVDPTGRLTDAEDVKMGQPMDDRHKGSQDHEPLADADEPAVPFPLSIEMRAI
jgi:hypothetical protein